MAGISAAAANELIYNFFSSIAGFQITTMDELYAKVVLADDLYSPVSREELVAIAKGNPLMVPPAVDKTDLTDCDDYALQLKALITAQYRQQYLMGARQPLPPAIAIVISNNHAVNLFIEQDNEGENKVYFIDASAVEISIASEPEHAAQIMKEPPVRFIYM